MLLQRGEEIKALFSASLVQSGTRSRNGTLLLTNQRLIFRANQSFSSQGDLKLDLASLEAVTIEPSLAHGSGYSPALKVQLSPTRKLLLILSPSSAGEPSLDDVPALIVKLRELEGAEKVSIGATAAPLDFSWLTEFMKKGGYVLTTFNCPRCGAAVNLPEEGEVLKCEHCGSTVYAFDVIKRIKELMKERTSP